MFLTGPLRAGGHGHRHGDLVVGFQQHLRQRRFASARGRGQHEEQPSPVQLAVIIVDILGSNIVGHSGYWPIGAHRVKMLEIGRAHV